MPKNQTGVILLTAVIRWLSDSISMDLLFEKRTLKVTLVKTEIIGNILGTRYVYDITQICVI